MTVLLELDGVSRHYASGGGTIAALDGISLEIAAGEMIAIMGASGSGKSTLMNILGCLDRPTAGRYVVDGQDVAALDSDALARLRRERFGFVFQRYHLLPHLSALGNVELPAIYAGYDKQARTDRALGLLGRLGLSERATHRPNEMSGGQQQRASIARALMNGGEILLADEPSGALDHASGEEVLGILRELHGLGHTIIIVTHDARIAAHAERIVEISDGRIIRDTGRPDRQGPVFAAKERPRALPHGSSRAVAIQLLEALKMALQAMLSNRLRSALTMLGIVIGIMSVVSIVALGRGAQTSMLKSLNEASGNVFTVYRGANWDSESEGSIQTMTSSDMEAAAALPDVENVKPVLDSNERVRRRHVDALASVSGAGADGSRSFGLPIILGRDLNEDDVRDRAQVAVIDFRLQERLFGRGENPLGETILIGNAPWIVIGVTGAPTGAMALDQDPRMHASIPYTTAGSHLVGRSFFDGMSVKVRADWPMKDAQKHVEQLLQQRHGKKDFKIFDEDSFVQGLTRIVQVATLVLTLVGTISLGVGGVGVMNIMLVSVTERTREIGIRRAVGAQESDIRNQFLIEAVTLCLVGGSIGVALAFAVGGVVNLTTNLLRMEVSLASIIAAFAVSTALGVLFGFWPARNAARLDPIEALARD